MTRLITFLLFVAFAAVGSSAEAADDLKALTARAEGGDVKAQLDLAYQYLGCAKTFALMGRAFAEELLKLSEPK